METANVAPPWANQIIEGIDNINNQIYEHAVEFDERFEQLDGRFDALNARFDDLENLLYEYSVESDERFEELKYVLHEMAITGAKVRPLPLLDTLYIIFL
jgi:hypothetical protein